MTTLDTTYWQRYYDAATVARSAALRQEMTLLSTGVRLHLDVYEQPERSAPTLIYNHGGGGYSRFFVGLALALYARGYTVVLPNQRGQGYSEGDRGDFVIGDFIQNIRDVTHWSRQRYSGALFVGGASVGSGLVYQAAAGTPVDALICHNLYNFGDARDALALSRLAALRHMPGIGTLTRLSMGALVRLLPRLRVPFGWLGRFEAMVDARDTTFYRIWQADPLPIKAVTLRYLHSTWTTPPDIPYEQNRLPILVINPLRDTMVAPAVTRQNYERLGGPKQYAEIEYGHWATGEQFTQEYTALLTAFMTSVKSKC